jgi:hypothetical protein
MAVIQITRCDAWCDECKRTFGDSSDEPDTSPGAARERIRDCRADMKFFGWVRRGNRDLCPKCKDKGGA